MSTGVACVGPRGMRSSGASMVFDREKLIDGEPSFEQFFLSS